MSRLVEFPLEQGGGRVVVEVEEAVAGPARVAKASEVSEKAVKTFEEAADGIRSIARTVLDRLVDLGPQAVEVELGVKFSATAGVVLAKAASEGNCKITLKWTK